MPVVGYMENTAGDWSFGFDRAQSVTDELAVPQLQDFDEYVKTKV